MRRGIFIVFICLYVLSYSAMAATDTEGSSSVTALKDNYVLLGVSSGGDKQLNTVVIFDSEKKYAWWLNSYSAKMSVAEPKWRFKDLSEMEPKKYGGFTLEE